jgi:GNAT superfamily N-acetyltransferase
MRSRDHAERALAKVVDGATRTFLQRVLDAVTAAIRDRRTGDAQPVLALGIMLGWWTDAVAEPVVDSVRKAWGAAFGVTMRGQTASSPRADAMAFHIAAVRDRLSRSALPEVPEAAFDQVRLSQSAAALGGWGPKEQARDVAERLAWEPDKSYWKAQKAEAERRIDEILDPLGRPGTPARTYAHKHDPAVKVWQSVRAEAVAMIRADESTWHARATRIARTESTAAWNSGALAALAEEGRTHKRWLATKDPRTRESHRLANGQVVPLARPFRVGESLLMMPGDPAAPPWETINCRCTVLGADEPAHKALTASLATYNADQLRVPKGNGELSGRWVDSPSKVLADLMTSLSGYSMDDPMYSGVELAQGQAAAFDPHANDGAPLLDVWDTLETARGVAVREGRSDEARQIAKAQTDLSELADVDWSLFQEDTDIRGSEVTDIGASDAPEGWDEAPGSNEQYPIYVNQAGYMIEVDSATGAVKAYDPNGDYVGSDDGNFPSVEAAADQADQESGAKAAREQAASPSDETLDETIARTETALADLIQNYEDSGDMTWPDIDAVAQGMTARINKIAEGRGIDLRVVLTESGDDGSGLKLGWNFMTPDGRRAGTLDRRITLDDRTVYNEYFQITKEFQGGGLASGLTSGLEQWYQESGIERIKVHANIDVGGYTWARLGFAIDGEEDDGSILPSTVANLTGGVIPPQTAKTAPTLTAMWSGYIRGRVDRWDNSPPDMDAATVGRVVEELGLLGYGVDESEGWWADVENDPSGVMDEMMEAFRQTLPPDYQDHMSVLADWATAVEGGFQDELPSMYELATFGQGTDLQWEETVTILKPDGTKEERTLTTWPGKQALLGSNWMGVKEIGDGW